MDVTQTVGMVVLFTTADGVTVKTDGSARYYGVWVNETDHLERMTASQIRAEDAVFAARRIIAQTTLPGEIRTLLTDVQRTDAESTYADVDLLDPLLRRSLVLLQQALDVIEAPGVQDAVADA